VTSAHDSNVGTSVEEAYVSPLMQKLLDLADSSIKKGLPEDSLRAILDSTLEAGSEKVAEALRKAGPKMLRHHSKIRRGFEKRLRKRWSAALDLFEMVMVAALEAGEMYHHRNRPKGEPEEAKAHAMALLHARACLIASEVYALLRTGHAAGAQARWRTLHELATVAFILGPNDGKISERFLLHRYVDRRKDARCYQENHAALGQVPFTDAEMAQIELDYQEVVSKFESGYEGAWGWAKPLFSPTTQPNFDDLEKLAGLDHNKPYVRLSHHSVHGGATGAVHIQELYGLKDGSVMLAGPSDVGLAEPGTGCLIALYQVTVAFLLYGHGPIDDAENLLCLKTIAELVDNAGQAFGECAEAVESFSEA
jgi:hypothetical protein